MDFNWRRRTESGKRIVAAAAILGTLFGVPAAAQSGDESRRDRRERKFDDDKFDRRRFDDDKFEDRFKDGFDARRFDLRIRNVQFRDRGRPVLFIRGEGFSRRTRVAIFDDEVRDVRFVSRGLLVVDLSRFDRRAFDRGSIVVVVSDGDRRDRFVVR